MTSPLVVLDTPALFYRAFYALPDTLRDSAGTPVNAARGLLDTLATLVELTDSRRLIAAMDADWRPAFRTAVVPEYKAQRIKDADAGTEMPDDLAVQLPIITGLLQAAGIPVAEVPGTEADDVIASITAQTTEPVIVVSSDRDLLSLLAPDRDITVLRPRPGGVWESLRIADLPAAYGVRDGAQYRELAALRGDPSDGLDGVPGIGEKTAAKLLCGYGDLPGVFTAAESGVKDHGLSAKRRQALLTHRQAVQRTHQVMTCREDLPVAEFVAAAGSDADAAALTGLAAQHSLASSAERLLTVLQPGSAPFPGAARPDAHPALFSMPVATTAITPVSESWVTGPLWGFDLETTGVDPHSARIVSAALVRFDSGSPVEHRTWLVDPGTHIPAASVRIHGITPEHARAHGLPIAVAVPQILAAVARIASRGGMLVGHNVDYDLTILQHEATRLSHSPDARAVCPPVLDTFVLDKEVHRHRRGSRVLGAVCAEWGVRLDAAHEAAADAIAAVRIALAIAAAHPEIASYSPAALHDAQARWKRDQATSLQKHLRCRSRPQAVVNGDWPFETCNPPPHV